MHAVFGKHIVQQKLANVELHSHMVVGDNTVGCGREHACSIWENTLFNKRLRMYGCIPMYPSVWACRYHFTYAHVFGCVGMHSHVPKCLDTWDCIPMYPSTRV